ncbi:MAG TPA: hypothetical protein VK658_14860 [Chryseolinea sp.]|nr:hypothetical protein [Chryseolinea sp.]
MGVIDIGTVLAKFDDTVDEHSQAVKSYGVQFITSDGRFRTMKARKNVKSPSTPLQGLTDERGRVMYNLKRNGVMLLQDLDLSEPRSVKVAMICGFKDFNTDTWLRVKH